MSEKLTRSWVWRSTEESRAAGLVSVLAVTETVACVAMYWVLMFWFGVTWHHWLILIATPMVLLRSQQSVALGLGWFERYGTTLIEDVDLLSAKGLAATTLGLVVASFAVWILAQNWEVGETGGLSFIRSALLGWMFLSLVLLITSATVVPAQFKPLIDKLSLFSAIPLLFGVLGRAMLTRFVATAFYIPSGLASFPSNWRFSLLISDLFHPPELIPGDNRFCYSHKSYLGFSHKFEDGTPKSAIDLFAGSIGSFVFFVPTILWRWAIKSTAWFYVPLLWVRRGWSSHEGEELRIWANTYSGKALNWIWLISGGLSIAALSVVLFSVEKWLTLQQTTSSAGAPMGLFGFLWSLNWAELLTKPWLWFLVPSYALTVIIFFALNSIAAEIRDIVKNKRDPALLVPREAKIAQWRWTANARAVLTNIGLLLALWYFLGAVDACGQAQDFFTHWF